MLEEQVHSWEQKAEEIQLQIGYKFHNSIVLKSAFTHCSYANEILSDCPTNERLEFLGDAVLSLVTAQYLFTYYPDLEEGALTKIRSRVVDSKSCYHYTQHLDIGRHMFLGKGEQLETQRGHANILADLFEALVGAIYLDGGLEEAQRFLLRFLQPAIEQALERPCDNWKAQLQEFCQKIKRKKPSYEILATSGPDHDRNYICGVLIEGHLTGKGEGKSKKQAQQKAAREAIMFLLTEEQRCDQTENELDV
ncbi:ribonuclease III [Candidatus Similichlamydia laticola]|uniref:Ribonuclease 3 n=1 Tax=Candidatus Similichlamydia laticola TaxID=2170265 RepID=A0A369KCM8_9BACT|nr:ribonuclease III [Candidatus Similichlamydia laticola]RDB31352.1 Ribonuclease III [Candidatus Similichlamydia laticola]